jgi:hypothetical protein
VKGKYFFGLGRESIVTFMDVFEGEGIHLKVFVNL